MTDDKQRKAPVLRFKGFHDDWEQRKLGSKVNFYNGLTYHPDDVKELGTFVIRSNNVKNNQIIKSNSIKVSSNIINVPNVEKDDIVVVVRNGSKKLIGKHALINNSMPNTVIGAFMTGIRSNNNKFIKSLLDSSLFKKEIQKNLGATINQITISDFKNMKFNFPTSIEQNKIGNLILKIDKLLSLQQRKLDLLKQLKKGLLQKMFADKTGYPALRFKGFNDDWKHHKFKDVLKTHSFRQYLAAPQDNGNFEVIQQGDTPIIGYANGKPFTNYKEITLFGDHTLSLYKPIGPFFVATDGVKILSADGFDGQYFFATLERYKPKPQGYKRHFTILKNQNMWFTRDNYEQKKIGEFFTNFDSLITLHQHKIDNLKRLKRALLQKMFV